MSPRRSDLTYPRIVVRKGRKRKDRWFGYVKVNPVTVLTHTPALSCHTPQQAVQTVLASQFWKDVQPVEAPAQEPTA